MSDFGSRIEVDTSTSSRPVSGVAIANMSLLVDKHMVSESHDLTYHVGVRMRGGVRGRQAPPMLLIRVMLLFQVKNRELESASKQSMDLRRSEAGRFQHPQGHGVLFIGR